MPLQFTTIEEPSFARGIDARSAENQIQAGFAKDLVNVDIVETRIRKRRGYSSHAGGIPVRVREVRQGIGSVSFVLDSSTDLARTTPGPVLAYGKSGSITSGPFTTAGNTSRYYETWTSNLRKSFLSSTSSTISAPYTEHLVPSTELFVGLATSTSTDGSLLSGNSIFSDVVSIDETSKDITVSYVNNTSTTQSVFLFYRDQQPIIGKSYTHLFSVATGSSPHAEQIDADDHNLDNYNIVYQLYQKEVVLGVTSWKQVKPGDFQVNTGTGLVTVSIYNTTGLTQEYQLLLASVPLSQTKSSISTSGITSTEILNIESPFVFYAVYQKSGSIITEVIPDEVVYDDEEKKLTVSWSEGASGANLEFYYEYGTIRANEIQVTDPLAITAAIDSAPQVVLYGLNHADIYGNDKQSGRKGWVTHIDSYRSPATTHVVAGLGGNLFAAESTSDVPETLPTYFPKLNARVNGNQVIGPAFYEPSAVPLENSGRRRTRGYYVFDGGLFHWAVVTSVTYDAGSGNTAYVLSVPNLNIEGGTGTPVEPGDILTVEKMSHSRHSGSFEIVSVSAGVDVLTNTDILTITVKNPKLTTDDYNDTNTEGRAGVFSDRVTLSANSPFLAGDALLSSSWDSTEGILAAKVPETTVTQKQEVPVTTIQVASTLKFPATGSVLVAGQLYSYTSITATSITLANAAAVSVGDTVQYAGTRLWVSNCYDYQILNNGLAITGKRKSATIPLRTIDPDIAQVTNIVAGDVLSFSELAREVTVLSVNPAAKTITVDEELEWYDDLSLPPQFTVARRWYPVEVPTRDATDVLIPPTTVQHFAADTYGNQSFLRSAMVMNNMYLTNGEDEVYKYDGENLYRAGVIPWQPGLFAAVENVGSGGIVLPINQAVGIDGVTVEGNTLKLSIADAAKFQKGDIVQVTGSTTKGPVLLTISSTQRIEDTDFVAFYFNETLSKFTNDTTISSFVGVYYSKYYFRLNVKDKNGVTTAGAVTGDDSFIVTLTPTTTTGQVVNLRLVGMPAWDQYDFRGGNIELEIYRTLWTTGSIGDSPKWYRLKTIPLTYEANSGYIDFTDSYSNDTLQYGEVDAVTSVLTPVIPYDWDEPSRSKYVTTVGNRLVLANVKSWPELTVNFLANKDTTYSDFNNKIFTFKRDSSKSITTTDMLNCVRYQLRNTSEANSIVPVDGDSNKFKFKYTGATPTPPNPGMWVYLYYNTPGPGHSSNIVFISGSEFVLLDVDNLPKQNELLYFSGITYAPTYDGGKVLDLNRGYFVYSVDTKVVTTVKSSVTNSTTLPLNSAVNFPDLQTHYIVVNGIPHTYSGISVSGGTSSLTNVSPPITAASNDIVTLAPGVRIALDNPGLPISFDALNATTSGTGTSVTTVNVISTADFPQAGVFTYGGALYSYTSKTATSFVGISPNITYTNGQSITFFSSAGIANWGNAVLDYTGWYQIANINGATLEVFRSGTNWTSIPKQFPDRALFATNSMDVPVLLGTDGNMGMTTGNGPVPYLNVIRRLGMAINATMRTVSTTIQVGGGTPYANFVPWLMAHSESFTGGTLVVRRPRADGVTPSLTVSGGSTTAYSTYINDELAPNTAVLARTTRYPSRVLFSYDSYPEIFSNPFTLNVTTTDSAIDINAADGQEITGIFTFFGSAAFGASQQTGVLVVFKTNSIYVVNPTTREVQKLETQGLGCTAPYSIASTKDGVAFANESGIYVLRRDLGIDYMGRFMERNWSERVNFNALSLAQGHHYGIGKQYKLSVPMVENNVNGYAQNEEVYVYAYTSEAEGNPGGWTRYTNHAVTGWCNLYQNAFFGDVNGNVQRIRNLGEKSDYRDGNVAIESIIETRPTNFDNSAIRKSVNNVVVHYRSNAVSESTTLGMAIDLATEYQLSTAYKVVTANGSKNGISDQVGQYVQTIMHSFPRPRCLYAAVKITNNGLDENVEVAGMGYVVAGLSSSGIKQAAETTE